jgi:hypothetical protein
MKTAHTPIPWVAHKLEGENKWVISKFPRGDRSICTVHNHGLQMEQTEAEANAKIIEHRVNTYEPLVAALSAVLKDVDAGNAETRANSRWAKEHEILEAAI